MSRRVWLVGESNPYQSHPRPEFDLYPRPAGSAGARLARVLGYDDEGYLATFERRNLIYGQKWSVPRARSAASLLVRDAIVEGGDHAFVLLGARVSAAFGVPFEVLTRRYLSVAPSPAIVALVVPHPSGLSRAWNDPTMAPRVREAVQGLLYASEPATSGRRRRYPEG